MKSISVNTNRHSVYFLQYHLVVVTKYGYPILTGNIANRLDEISHSVMEKDWKCHIAEMKIYDNYVHIFFEAPPQVQPSRLVNNYKTVTSRLIRKEFSEDLKVWEMENLFWNRSYFICTVSDHSESMMKEYVHSQIENAV